MHSAAHYPKRYFWGCLHFPQDKGQSSRAIPQWRLGLFCMEQPAQSEMPFLQEVLLSQLHFGIFPVRLFPRVGNLLQHGIKHFLETDWTVNPSPLMLVIHTNSPNCTMTYNWGLLRMIQSNTLTICVCYFPVQECQMERNCLHVWHFQNSAFQPARKLHSFSAINK